MEYETLFKIVINYHKIINDWQYLLLLNPHK